MTSSPMNFSTSPPWASTAAVIAPKYLFRKTTILSAGKVLERREKPRMSAKDTTALIHSPSPRRVVPSSTLLPARGPTYVSSTVSAVRRSVFNSQTRASGRIRESNTLIWELENPPGALVAKLATLTDPSENGIGTAM